ncbi:Phosphoserine aminotransferase [Pseudoscardovia radai]|jgi:phosphoserine aminotransferase|uniref:Phosphoserine aminotransferase n=1 Tax=Pseudoscardovia radai TaxID=987066 RepID=A0A261EZ36_9BIFI|nr:phosphoserine transaminase [Pseudoscardovia radai]OZG52124.1 Phosphoserine aminotransferase [Pseudoscardovia radai]
MTTTVTIPQNLLPQDGRFGSGPSRIREDQAKVLFDSWRSPMGTSHRQDSVKDIVASVRKGLTDLFRLPDGYEVVLGNGGASQFFDIACASLIDRKAAFGVCGSFSEKFAKEAQGAPFLEDPVIVTAPYGQAAVPEFTEGVDTYCWPQSETSTGVMIPVKRVPGSKEAGALTIIDATSCAGALPVDMSECDAYFFSPQKAMGAEGGLWVAILSPAAIARAEAVEASATLEGATRWVPAMLSLTKAIKNSRKNQTLNTPAIATLILMNEQIKWINANGGLDWSVARCRQSSGILYDWAEKSDYATPFVPAGPARSDCVVTVNLDDAIPASEVLAHLRANGIVDCGGYRALGLNQLRIGVFPSVEPGDVEALTQCIDYVVDQMRRA